MHCLFISPRGSSGLQISITGRIVVPHKVDFVKGCVPEDILRGSSPGKGESGCELTKSASPAGVTFVDLGSPTGTRGEAPGTPLPGLFDHLSHLLPSVGKTASVMIRLAGESTLWYDFVRAMGKDCSSNSIFVWLLPAQSSTLQPTFADNVVDCCSMLAARAGRSPGNVCVRRVLASTAGAAT
jgi:hypothetical protein